MTEKAKRVMLSRAAAALLAASLVPSVAAAQLADTTTPPAVVQEAEVQQAVADLWKTVSKENIKEIADIDGYWQDFYEIFGFRIDGVDYDADVDIQKGIPSLAE